MVLPTREWMVKMTKPAEMAKLIALIREKTLIKFNAYWKPLLYCLHVAEKNEIKIY